MSGRRWSSDPTEVWLRRALEEVTALRPQVRIGPGDLAPLRDYLCDRWLGAQIRYHEKSARRQGTWDSRLFAATGVLFAITAVAAFLHLLGWGEHDGKASELGMRADRPVHLRARGRRRAAWHPDPVRVPPALPSATSGWPCCSGSWKPT